MNTEMKQKFKEVIDWLVKEYAGIRTGQASPAILDSVRVESYGTLMSLQQVGSISIEDIRTLRVVPWDASQVVAIEKAVRDADLGVSVVTDSSGLRVIFPELTSERRVQLLKLAKSKLEDARISVRSIRDDEMKEIERQFKANEIGEDDKFTYKEAVQKAVEETNNDLEGLFVNKERELQK
ncbi:MAG: Ribosome-recycling factor [Parcubacteria bacterium OLB19]|nr:MAG: Ribosome-recycling factor [Parcubacteria bacterium OLB19]